MNAKLIDTHAHLYSSKFQHDQDAVIERAKAVLSAVVLPNIDLESVGPMLDLAGRDPAFFFPTMGLHPCSVDGDFEKVLAKMEALLAAGSYYGIGETGIDLYWDKTWFEQQKEALKIQIDWAKAHRLPIILHCRNSMDHVIELIEAHQDERLSGIFHCFDGSLQQARRIMALGSFKLGIGGIVTYRKDVQEVVRELPLACMVLETDSPYLPPEPHRKDKPRRNESSYTRYVAAKLAELHQSTYEEVARITNENARALFGVAAV